ncbi:MAG: hypothetical protein BWY72_02080 [Bacteroidetes bacterium ADurb.Bin416]|nr:MAG: hypothetical protein BWY72_02080 [Bacteroidetes bacterium ADurb.Bin416]
MRQGNTGNKSFTSLCPSARNKPVDSLVFFCSMERIHLMVVLLIMGHYLPTKLPNQIQVTEIAAFNFDSFTEKCTFVGLEASIT